MTRERETRLLGYVGAVSGVLGVLLALGLGATIALASVAAIVGFYAGLRVGYRRGDGGR